ncbi:SHOCT domain-containing protein [Mycolicibacterium litorale]|uniref:Membrane protein n=1 Tax=Mycolicibacterium litorale TaxID=758802 RepID=A0AAD1IMM3_9MYCO|nr:SHOCT domain-containing protein [Mycolicibacterium litorale]MCV7416363.1 SHOCT domain-containing protein [Mycolicibacterium litorale]TDY09617.1 putative oligomerization/nucleic acid binding protein [Mycolicibacterium litorale]BBY17561.1 membrane protein [Mycolicibacterium litorale]
MSTFWRYIRIQLFVLLCGIVGPIFLAIYFLAGPDPMMEWMFWTGLLITAADVLIALGITAFGAHSAAKTAELEARGVLGLAQITAVHDTNTRINEQPLVKLDLQISGPGLTPFTAQDRVVATVSRLPLITNRKLVVIVDPATNEYQIDWDRSALVGGLMPATFTVSEDNQTYDLTGQAGPLLEILQILKTHGIGMDNMIDLRANPTARQHVQAVVRQAARQMPAPAAMAPSAPMSAPTGPSTAQRLQELETLRATGAITDAEYTAKRQQIIEAL